MADVDQRPAGGVRDRTHRYVPGLVIGREQEGAAVHRDDRDVVGDDVVELVRQLLTLLLNGLASLAGAARQVGIELLPTGDAPPPRDADDC